MWLRQELTLVKVYRSANYLTNKIFHRLIRIIGCFYIQKPYLNHMLYVRRSINENIHINNHGQPLFF